MQFTGSMTLNLGNSTSTYWKIFLAKFTMGWMYIPWTRLNSIKLRFRRFIVFSFSLRHLNNNRSDYYITNSITRSLNIVAIMTKNKDQKQMFLSIELYIWLTNGLQFGLQLGKWLLACVSQIYSFADKNICFRSVFCQNCNHV